MCTAANSGWFHKANGNIPATSVVDTVTDDGLTLSLAVDASMTDVVSIDVSTSKAFSVLLIAVV